MDIASFAMIDSGEDVGCCGEGLVRKDQDGVRLDTDREVVRPDSEGYHTLQSDELEWARYATKVPQTSITLCLASDSISRNMP